MCNIVKTEGNITEVAAKLNRTEEQLTCTDCKTALHQDCKFVVCCKAKGLNNCSECPDLPCGEVIQFAQDGMKHHALIIDNLFRIRQIGMEVWQAEQKQRYTCKACGARLSWLATCCDKCGGTINGMVVTDKPAGN